MKGKVVLLQRLRGRSWVTIRSARLAYKPSYEHGALNHEAVFPVQYGWTLRVVLPAKSAAPCYRSRRQRALPGLDMSATFPLIPRRRVLGLPFGGLHSIRRGLGSDVAGSRLYQPGDDIDKIDWHASAKLSLARGSEEFIVREHYAEEAPRVVVLCDRRPSMSIFDETWPWLRKPEAIRQAATVIGISAVAARGLLGYFDEGDGSPYWHPPRSTQQLGPIDLERPFQALGGHRRARARLPRRAAPRPSGGHVRLHPLRLPRAADARRVAARARAALGARPGDHPGPDLGAELPGRGGTVVPFADPVTGDMTLVRFTEQEVEERRETNERRLRELVRSLRALDMDPLVVSSHELRDVVFSFLSWADQRLFTRGRG